MFAFAVTLNTLGPVHALDSITVTDVSSPLAVAPGTSFSVTVTVQYSFGTSTRVEVDIYDYTTSKYISRASVVDYLKGTGQKSYTFTLTSPQSSRMVWSLSATAFYGPNNDQVANGWFSNFEVIVEIPTIETTTFMLTSISTTAYTSTVATTNYPLTLGFAGTAFILGIVVALMLGKRTRRYGTTTTCPKCGTINPEQNDFCGGCGFNLDATMVYE